MNKHTKIVICVLAIFIVGMTLSVAFAEPVNAKKYKNKKSITVKIKDGKKTIKVKCKYTAKHIAYMFAMKKRMACRMVKKDGGLQEATTACPIGQKLTPDTTSTIRSPN